MKQSWYDIYKGKPDTTRRWLESLNNLDRATDQMNHTAVIMPGDYFIVDSATGNVVASVSSAPPRWHRSGVTAS
jgi:hypothetical protein